MGSDKIQGIVRIRLENLFNKVFQFENLKNINLNERVYAKNCLSLNSQSSNKLLIQIGEILNLLPNRVHLNDSNISEQNRIEIICEINEWGTSSSSLEPRNLTGIIKMLEVHVECLCCPQISSDPSLPFLSVTHGVGSSSVSDDIEPQPLLPLSPSFSSSCMDQKVFNNEGVLGLSTETRNNGCDLSLSSKAYPIRGLVFDDSRHLPLPSSVGSSMDKTSGPEIRFGSTTKNENNLIKFQEIHLPCCFTICHAFNAKKFIVMDDLLVGTEGRYILVTRVPVKEDDVALQVDLSMNLALQWNQRSGTELSLWVKSFYI
ncbi:hypothetical protein CMV_008258 [Castanea mollissima]|uniref:Uncharacterized protein n=1 Tax=Castanea mollissima TaxID=60419 RepID=A0A8J4RGV0_9ROSI|nr:hypothetical protein CMV_008258 [Castanea mollissima]